MHIEVGAPAVLPLALVHYEIDGDTTLCLLGLTLQHPPVHLFAEPKTALVVTGARADRGAAYARRVLDYYDLLHYAEIEIELAIPAFMGLGSDAMLGLGIAHAIAQVHDLPAESDRYAAALGLDGLHALERRAFGAGGLLLVTLDDDATIVRRQEIAHEDRDAWALVLFLPRMPADTPTTLERTRLQTYVDAASYLDTESGRLLAEQLWPAVADDDLVRFGGSLHTLRELNQVAIERAGSAGALADGERGVLDIMKAQGAVACGQSLSGHCIYALLRGAAASIELRKAIRAREAPFAGRTLATVTDNAGVRSTVRQGSLDDNKLRPPRLQ